MPSLKDLRNRIASVKATQKITKAMQMVAAAKLRRAQEAAEAARPMPNAWRGAGQPVAQASGQSGCAPKLMAGTGKDECICWLSDRRTRPVRRLQLQHRQAGARDMRRQAQGRGQDGQDPHRRQEGL
jgi:hypothetical protein